jgi:hypothetical protein
MVKAVQGRLLSLCLEVSLLHVADDTLPNRLDDRLEQGL